MTEALGCWEPQPGFAWDEPVAEGPHHLDAGMVSFLIFAANGQHHQIGTGFIIGAHSATAVAVTAAHVFASERVAKAISGKEYHPSALPNFRPTLQLAPNTFRAIYRDGNAVEFANVHLAVWDPKTDLCVVRLTVQQPNQGTFTTFLKLQELPRLEIGDPVGVLGYADMSVSVLSGGRFRAGRRLAFRIGRVTNVCPDGTGLLRGPCIETSIPVFEGWSGGPAVLRPGAGREIIPFGFISHDAEAPAEVKMDRSKPGNAIISLLPLRVSDDDGVSRTVQLRLDNVSVARNEAVDRAFLENMGVLWVPDQ
jgi:hypothetical protein